MKTDELKTLAGLGGMVKDLVRKMGETFTEPDDDWAPVAWLVGRGGKVQILNLGELFRTSETKDAVPGALAAAVRQFRAAAGAVAVSQWYVSEDARSPLLEVSTEMMRRFGVSSRPDRREQVSVEVCDGKDDQVWNAEILRDGKSPPRLGEWVLFEPDASSGRLDRVMLRAFRAQGK